MQHDVFISYTQPDRNVASYIHDVLQHNDLSSWMAPSGSNGIITGKPFEQQVVQAIGNSKIFVLVYSDYCNKSADVIQEIRHRNKHHPTIIIRLDQSVFRDDLSYYLRGIQYINAAHNNPRPAANILLRDILKILGKSTGARAPNVSMDRTLFLRGLGLINEKKYREAAECFQQHLDIEGSSNDTRFYLSLAIIGGKKTRKLDGLMVRKLENLLIPAVSNHQETGFINALLAIIKQGYYQGNGFRVPEPTVETLVNGTRLSAEKVNELLTHLYEPENIIWQQLVALKNKTQ